MSIESRFKALGIEYANNESVNFKKEFSYKVKKGMGITIGNSLRRTILGHIPGYAIRNLTINSGFHEFSTIAGLKESVQILIMNLRKIIFKGEIEKSTAYLNISNKSGEIYADSVQGLGLEVVNKHLYLCTLTDSVDLRVDMEIEKGIGYILAKDVRGNSSISSIICDSFFSPIVNVNFEIESIENNNFEEILNLSIVTNGSISPEEALDQSVIIWRDELAKISEKIIEPANYESSPNLSIDTNKIYSIYLSKKIKKLDLPSRVLSCLTSLDIKYIGQLVQMTEEQLLNEPKFGQGSLDNLKNILNNMSLSLGMHLDGWVCPEYDDNEEDGLIG